MKNTLIFLFLAAALVLVVLYAKTGQVFPEAEAPAEARDPVAERVAALEKQLRERGQEVDQLRALLAEARAQRAAAEEQAAAVKLSPAPAIPAALGGPLSSTNSAMGQIIQAVTSALTNPATMRSIRQNVGAWSRMREHLYDDLLARAGLTDAQRTEFQRLMRQRRRAEFMGGFLGDEEERQNREAAESGLRQLLGSRYDELALYEKQLPARMFAERFTLFMEGRQTDLAPEKKARLISALAEIPGMQVGEAGSQLSAKSGAGPAGNLGAAVERQLDLTVEKYDRIVAAAQPILSAEENKALDEFLGERLQEQEMGANLTKAILPALMGSNSASRAGSATNTAVSVQTIVMPP